MEADYELNTGKVIVETIENRNINPLDVPGIVVKIMVHLRGVIARIMQYIMRLLWKKLQKWI